MNEWNDLFFLNEADDDEEKEKNKDKKEDKDEEKEDKSEKKSKKDKEKEDEDYNDLMDDDIELDKEKDTDSSDDEDYNDLMDDVSSDDSEDELNDDNDFMKDDDSDNNGGDDYNTLVVVKTDEGDSDSDGASSVYEKAAKVAYVYTVIANNLKHIHLNACGKKFNEIHSVCDEYYHHFSYQADFYYELAAESPIITIDNPTRAKEHCEDINVEMDKEYDFRKAMETITSNFSSALKYLDELRDAASSTRPDIQSKVDDELIYINKQSNYFIRKKLCGMDNSVEESYNSLL